MVDLKSLFFSKDLVNVKLALVMRNSFSSNEWWDCLLIAFNNYENSEVWATCVIGEKSYLRYNGMFFIRIRNPFIYRSFKKYRIKDELKKILDSIEQILNN